MFDRCNFSFSVMAGCNEMFDDGAEMPIIENQSGELQNSIYGD
jgi:hypothetical protein